jgi:hypothetical protein
MYKFSKERHKTQLNPSPKFSSSLSPPPQSKTKDIKALRESLEPLLSSGTRSARRKSTNICTQKNFQRERKNRKEREGKGRELDYCLPGRPKYLIEQPLPKRRRCLARGRKPCLPSCSSLLPVFASLSTLSLVSPSSETLACTTRNP